MQVATTSATPVVLAPPSASGDPTPDASAVETAELESILSAARTEPAPPPSVAKPAEVKPEQRESSPSPRDFIGLKKRKAELATREAALIAKEAELATSAARFHDLAKTDKIALLKEFGIDTSELMSSLTASALSGLPDDENERPVTRRELAAFRAERDAAAKEREMGVQAQHAERAFFDGVTADASVPYVHAWVELEGPQGRAKLAAAADALALDHHKTHGRWPTSAQLHEKLNAEARVDLDRARAKAERISALFGNGGASPGASGAASSRASAGGNGSGKPGSVLTHGALASGPPQGESEEEEEARLIALIRASK